MSAKRGCEFCHKKVEPGTEHPTFFRSHLKCYRDDDMRVRAVRAQLAYRSDEAGTAGAWGPGDIQLRYMTDPKVDIPAAQRYSAKWVRAGEYAVEDRWEEDEDRPCQDWPECDALATRLNGLPEAELTTEQRAMLGFFKQGG